MAINTNPQELDANSYVSVEDADAYFADHMYPGKWPSLTVQEKETALIYCTKLLDEHYNWAGSKEVYDRILRWPRVGALDCDRRLISNGVIPLQVEDATCELAKWMLDQDRTAENATRGFSSISVAVISLNIDKRDRIITIPDAVDDILRCIGTRAEAQAQMKRVIRR